ncbi:MAG: RNA polymerase sigma factor [Acidimicrobiia bacterium]
MERPASWIYVVALNAERKDWVRDERRAAVVLRYLADLPLVEIARVMGCAEGTVKATLHQSLARLRARVRRHRALIGAVVALLIAVIAVPVIALSHGSDDRPSVAAAPAGATQHFTSTRYRFSVDIPRGWTSKIDVGRGDRLPVLFRSKSTPEFPKLDDCAPWAGVTGVSVTVQEVPYGTQISARERPRRFRPEHATTETAQCADSRVATFMFNDHGRSFYAVIASGGATPASDVEHAYGVLDSFHIGPPTMSEFCSVADDIAKPNPGTGSLAGDAEGAVRRLRRVAPSHRVATALDTVEPSLTDLDVFTSEQWRKQLTARERQALQVVDDLLQRCGLGSAIITGD